uniref:Uncharacterized protein n=1 Tax=Ditylenchus dipsaci TaxID=166011 RepID=A0A915ERD5_9BILA
MLGRQGPILIPLLASKAAITLMRIISLAFAILGASQLLEDTPFDNFLPNYCLCAQSILQLPSDKVDSYARYYYFDQDRDLSQSVKDGLDKIDGFKSISEKCKKIVKRIRKSDISRDESNRCRRCVDYQSDLLQKDVEIDGTLPTNVLQLRSKSTSGFFAVAAADVYPAFDAIEWSIMESIIDMLKPVYLSTIELQNRRTTIASVIRCIKQFSSNSGSREQTALPNS